MYSLQIFVTGMMERIIDSFFFIVCKTAVCYNKHIMNCTT